MSDPQHFNAPGPPTYGTPSSAPTPPAYAVPPGPPAYAVPPAQPGWAAAAGTMPYSTGQGRRVGKVRSPWGVWGLSLITLGIYTLYWWYTINCEVREYDERIDVQPGLSVLAFFIPFGGLVTLVRTGGRIGQAQRFGGLHDRCSGGLGILFAILLSTHLVYYQSQLNKLWAVHGNQPAGTRVA